MNDFTTVVIFVLVGIYGLCVGSFLNVVICRLPIGMKMTNERSQCPKCHSMIKWYDNIPLISYMYLGGKCRKCKEKISFRYPLNEAMNCILWLLSFLIFSDNLIYAGIAALACSVAICVFWIDFDVKLIYDRFNIILFCLGIAAIFFDNAKWYEHLIGAAAGFIGLFGIGYFVSKAKKAEALGMGDVKLATAMGMFLGWKKFLFAILVTSFSSCLTIIAMRLCKKTDENTEYPFAPFLTLGLVTSMLVGDIVMKAYFGLFIPQF